MPTPALVGLDAPRPAQDSYIQKLYNDYGLGETLNLREIEPVVIQLLGDPLTSIRASELVLGRQVSCRRTREGSFQDMDIFSLIVSKKPPEEKFGALLLHLASEEKQRARK